MQEGQQFGPYQLVKRIAFGGMAEIHLAKTSGIGGFEKLLALKVIHPKYSEDQEFIDMLIAMNVNPADYGISRASQSDGIDDAAFTLSVLNRGQGFENRGVNLNPQTMLPLTEWRSEGSYSGSAVLPTPGALALMGLGGVIAGRRRR